MNDVYASIENYITLKNNHISGGFYGIGLEASYSFSGIVSERGHVIYNNIIDSTWGYGIVTHYIDSLTISRNRVILSTINYGMYIYGTGSTNTDTTVIANNMIRLMGHKGVGLLVNYCYPLNVSYNSIVTFANAYTTAVLYSSGATKGVQTKNNIFMNLGGGYAINGNSAGMGTSDHNDFYTTGSTLGGWNGTTCSTLSDWKTTSGLDKNSVSGNPNFVSIANANLHLTPASSLVMQKGTPVSIVGEDFDAELRSNTPNIGADETKQIQLDASVISIDSPTVLFCSGTKNIYATIYNAGKDTIKNVTVGWSVDGITMTSYSWKGILAMHASAQIKLGSAIYSSHSIKMIKVWTSLPNGNADSNANNDTAYNNTGSGMSGNYTIGGSAPDFESFNLAAAALYKYGVCGITTFNARDGHYNESVVVKSVAGASRNNVITFQSQSLDSNKVMIDTLWSGGTYVDDRSVSLRLDGAKFVNFKKMSIGIFPGMNLTYADAMELAGGASYDSLVGNIFYTYPKTTLSWGANIYDDYNTVESHNTFYNNHITGGLTAMSISGITGINGSEKGNIIYHNQVDTIYGDGVICYYQDSLAVLQNNINLNFVNYGLYLSGCTGPDTSTVMNNFITLNGNFGIGFYSKDNAILNFLNNSVATTSTNAGFATAYFTGTTSNKVKSINNIFYNGLSGAAIYGDADGLSTSDYNIIYSAGATTGAPTSGSNQTANWAGTSLIDIKGWKSSSKMDSHSISGDPAFNDMSSGDLHLTPYSTLARHNGIHLSEVKIDFDGDKRKASKPDIGADEVPQDSNDIAVEAILSPINLDCGSANTVVAVKIANYGISNQKSSFNIHVQVSGSASLSLTQAFSGTLLGSVGPKTIHDTVIYLKFSPTWNSNKGGKYQIKVYTDLLNDGDLGNDTLTVTDSILAIPIAGFSLGSSAICLGNSISVTDNSTGKSLSYEYILLDKSGTHLDSSFSQNPSFTYGKAGKFRILQMIASGTGCTDTFSASFEIDNGGVDEDIIFFFFEI